MSNLPILPSYQDFRAHALLESGVTVYGARSATAQLAFAHSNCISFFLTVCRFSHAKMRSTRSSTKQIELAPLSGDELNQTQQIEPRNPNNTTRAKGAQNVQGAAQKQTGKQKRNHENRKAAVPSSKTTMKARAKRKKVKMKPASGTWKQKQNRKMKQTQTIQNPASVQQNSDESGGQDQELKSSSAVKSEVKEEPTTADSEPPRKKQKRNKDKPPKPPL